jgi:transcriptional regulator with XRE-family HTH domain
MRRRRLGVELRRLREITGLTGDQVVERVGWASASKLSRLENGRSRPDLGDVLDLLDVYGVNGPAREKLVAVTRDARNTRGWLRSYPVMTQRQRTYAELEAGCTEIREFAPAIVPGLLQIREYARMRIMSSRALADLPAGQVHPVAPETEVATRLARQSLLTRPEAPRYQAVLDESALTGRGGPPQVLRAQLAHLHELSALPNVALRILPRDVAVGDWYLPHTAFSVYRFADPQDPETVAVEGLAGDLIFTSAEEIVRYNRLFTWLGEAALPVEESRDWLAAMSGGPDLR